MHRVAALHGGAVLGTGPSGRVLTRRRNTSIRGLVDVVAVPDPVAQRTRRLRLAAADGSTG